MTAPAFSIITVVRNRVATIGQALDSLYCQTLADFEHVIQDACSTDGTLERLAAAADPRQRLVSERDDGIYDGLNRALARATGDYVGVLHSDDFLADARVLEDVARHFATTGADAVYGDLDYVAAADITRVVRRWRAGDWHPRRLARGWMPPHPALFLRRSVIERLGAYDSSYRIAADYESILRYFGSGISPAWLPRVLVKMRTGGASNRSLGHVLLKSREDYRALRTHRIGGLGTLLWKNASKLPQFVGRDMRAEAPAE